MTTNAAPPGPTEAFFAGFIVWLAHRHASLEQRRHAPEAVRLFVAWCHQQRDQGLDPSDNAYYLEMRRNGANEDQVARVGTALELFRRFLMEST
jgi:hypothetical protein